MWRMADHDIGKHLSFFGSPTRRPTYITNDGFGTAGTADGTRNTGRTQMKIASHFSLSHKELVACSPLQRLICFDYPPKRSKRESVGTWNLRFSVEYALLLVFVGDLGEAGIANYGNRSVRKIHRGAIFLVNWSLGYKRNSCISARPRLHSQTG